MGDEDLYLEATNEVEVGNTNVALWAKAMALSEGNHEKAKYQYIKLRVHQLIDIRNTNFSNEKIEEYDSVSSAIGIESSKPMTQPLCSNADNFFSKLTNGDYGLAKTYWIFGVIVGLLFFGVFKLINTSEYFGILIFLLVIYFIYTLLLAMGIWSAAKKYNGPQIWAILSRFAVIIGIIRLSIEMLFLTAY